MGRVLCFGELLLRLSPSTDGEWLPRGQLPVFLGGAELNVATALSRWGVSSAYCTALPDNSLSTAVCKEMIRRGVDISRIVTQGSRIGLYFIPQGTDLKTDKVIYDRARSAFSELGPGAVDWEKALDDVDYFHFSAITPALSDNLALVCREALVAATRRNIPVSIDLNYRPQLWADKRLPHTVMPDLVQHCALIMGNIWSVRSLLGLPVDPPPAPGATQEEYLDAARRTASELFEKYPRCEAVANTFRFDRSGGLFYYATLDTRDEQFLSVPKTRELVTDRVGSGDCFMAGLLYGFRQGHDFKNIIEFAATAAVMKTAEPGDATSNTVEAIREQMNQ